MRTISLFPCSRAAFVAGVALTSIAFGQFTPGPGGGNIVRPGDGTVSPPTDGGQTGTIIPGDGTDGGPLPIRPGGGLTPTEPILVAPRGALLGATITATVANPGQT